MLKLMNPRMKVVLFGAALSASVCVGGIMLYRATVTTGQESPVHSAILNSIPNPFRQKQQKRIVVMETADQEATLGGTATSWSVPNGYDLCKKRFNAVTLQELDELLANGGIVVGSPSEIREDTMSVVIYGNVGWHLDCQMRDYIIEQWK